MRWRRALLGWPLKAVLSLGLIALLAATVDWARIATSLGEADARFLVAALAALALTTPLTAERWRAAGRASRVRLPVSFFLRATYAAVFAGQFLPAGIGVDAARLGFLWHQKVPLRPAVQSLAVDRLAGVSAILFLMFAGMPFAVRLLPAAAVLPVVGTALLLVVACAGLLQVDRLPFPQRLRAGRMGHLLTLVADTRAAVATRPAAVAFACGVGLHALCILAVLLLARAFGHALDFRDLLTVVSFAIFAALLPISFNGWGVREGAMVLGLSLLAVGRDTALLISFLYGVGAALVALPGSLSWHKLRPRHHSHQATG
ncbi:MAG TPA: lysylphosphatidylglycerol synthase transmembrane domain-containing protein [Burkholderiales bacterium]